MNTIENNLNEIAVFGGGCFWCTEAVFASLEGVISVTPGYAGGHTDKPTYDRVSDGATGHAEVVRIVFDPNKITYRDLLTVFFASHDSTTLNRQGNDVGTQYRSIVLYTTEAQKSAAERTIREIDTSSAEGGRVVTEVAPLSAFYVAEEYHKEYYKKNPENAYCQIIINPKLKKVQQQFNKLLKKQSSYNIMENNQPMPRNDDEWKARLTPEQYEVLRNKGTEAPFSGAFVHEKRRGTYTCMACGNPLFSSDAKFDSGTGWPLFDDAIPGSVKFVSDDSHGMQRTEVTCAVCGSHLGHVFEDLSAVRMAQTDGSQETTGKRYCINSVCLDLKHEERGK